MQAKARMFGFEKLPIYPFLNESMEYIKQKEIEPIDALDRHSGILDRIRIIVADAMENKEETTGFDLKDDAIEVIFLYPWIRIILGFLNKPRVTYKVANLISKHFSNLLEKDLKKSEKGNNWKYWSSSTLLLIARDQGIIIKPVPDDQAINLNTVPFPFCLPVLEYLKISAEFKSRDWKLVNRLLLGGYVFLKEQNILRMIEEKIKCKISEINPATKDESFRKKFMEDNKRKIFFDKLLDMIKNKMAITGITDENLPIDDSSFPPCINAILDKNAKGINLTHSERLFLVYFLLTIGKSIEEVLDLFRNQPDYNEKISRYQVEFAAGKHGKQTQYKPHNCMTLESLNICKKADPIFGSKKCTEPKTPFKNPLTFYRRTSWGRAQGAKQLTKGKNTEADTLNQEKPSQEEVSE